MLSKFFVSVCPVHSSLGKLMRRISNGWRPATRTARAPFRPRLETFEDRLLPATLTWINPGGGAWEESDNWSDPHRLPGPADDVVISSLKAIAVITHTTDATSIHSLAITATTGTLSFKGGSLALATSSSMADTLAFSGGTISGPGDLSISGKLDWGSGTMQGTGKTSVSGGLTIDTGADKVLDARTLVNNGSATWSDSGTIKAKNGSIVDNNSTFSVMKGTQSFDSSDGITATFINEKASVFTEVGGATTFTNAAFNNSGTVLVKDSGALTLGGGGRSSGVFTVDAGSTLEFSAGTHQVMPAAKVSGAGTVAFVGGTTAIQGTYDVSGGTTIVDGGTVNFLAPVTSLGSHLSVSSGTAYFGTAVGMPGDTLSISEAVLSGGTLTGPGKLTIMSFTWTGGTMSDVGTTTVPADGTLTISGSDSKYLDGRTLINAVEATWKDGGSIVASNGSVFKNKGTLDVEGDAEFVQKTLPYNARFENDANATLVKSGGSGTTKFEVVFNNRGKLQAKMGTVSLERGSESTGGFDVADGATLNFKGGRHELLGTSHVTGSAMGKVGFLSGTTRISGSYTVTGETEAKGGFVYFLGTTSLDAATLTIDGGTAYFLTDVHVRTATLSGGDLTGPSEVTITTFTWSGGMMTDVGTTTIPASGAMTIPSGHVALNRRTLNNKGTTSAGSAGVTAIDHSVINNLGTITLEGTALFSDGTSTFNNRDDANLLITASSHFDVAFDNSGTIEVDDGTMFLGSGGQSSGVFKVAPGATVAFHGGAGTFPYAIAGTYTGTDDGTGTTRITAAAVEFLGTATFGKELTIDGATADARFLGDITLGDALTIKDGKAYFLPDVTVKTATLSGGELTGPGNISVTDLTWSGGTMSEGTTTVDGTLKIMGGGSAAKKLDGRTVFNNGAATWDATEASDITVTGGSIFNNLGTFDVQTDHSFVADSADLLAEVFNNPAGATFTKSIGAGVTKFDNVVFDNGDEVDVKTGTLVLGGGGTSDGSFTVEKGAGLKFAGGVYSISGKDASVSADGKVVFSGGITDIAAPYTSTDSTEVSGGTANFLGTPTKFSGTLTISSGTAYFFKDVSVDKAILSGGTLTGPGEVVIVTKFTWSGGTMSDVGTTTVTYGAALSIEGDADKFLDSRTVNNYSPDASWKGKGNILASNGSVFNNEDKAEFVIMNDQSFLLKGGTSPTFSNKNLVVKLAGSGTTVFGNGVAFNNSGMVKVATGSLWLLGGGTSSGLFVVGGMLQFGPGSHNLTETSMVTGPGAVLFSGLVDVRGTYSVAGATLVAKEGIVNFLTGGSTGTFMNSGKVSFDTGATTFGTGSTFTVGGVYSQSGTTFLNGANLIAGGVSIGKGSVFSGPGTITGPVINSGTLNIGGGSSSNSTGLLKIKGDYLQTASGTLNIKLGGVIPGQNDEFLVTGAMSLHGMLSVKLINGYMPAAGSEIGFAFYGSLTGTFAPVTPGAVDYSFHGTLYWIVGY